MNELMVSLLLWISGQTGLLYNGYDVPELVSVSAEALVRVQYEGNLPENYDPGSHGYLGLFDHNRNRVYLLAELDLDSVAGRSVLLHELVHYLQYTNNRHQAVECRRKLEEMAYFTQEAYLMEHSKPVPFSMWDVFYRMQCP
ncbi:MAG: hypothetical protein ACRBHB_10740 [Arenicella sp.]